MLTFQRVTYKNFLAAGNSPITIDLNMHQSTLVVGHNGTGKSTLSEAICFALYGRSLRNVNKPKLVNSINGRDLLVELDFKTSSGAYRIRRGIKPSIFEVYENGTLVPSPAASNDYQTLLETNILKLSFRAFQQVVILGNASYIPFMRLSANARRELVESLLDIEVFSAMNALAKDELSTLKNELDRTTETRRLLGEQVKMARDFTEHLVEQRQQQIDTIDANLLQIETSITKTTENITELDAKLHEYDDARAAYTLASARVSEFEKNKFAIKAKVKEFTKERAFYHDNDTCPKCEQSMSAELKGARFAALDEKEQGARKAVSQCDTLIAKYQTQVDTANTQLDESNQYKQQKAGLETELRMYEVRRKELRAELARLESKTITTPQAVDEEDLKRQLADLAKKHDDLSRKRVIMEAAGMLLRDNGIKSKVIRHYIPIINRTINAYLTAMDFPIQFMLNDEFVESIKSRYRDDFAYDSFSEGEKKRIDLALLLTWRAVARLKNSAASNLLILDEVFDSSLDANGTEEFLKIIAGLEKDTRVFVISHKTDVLVDRFSHTIRFAKNRGFSEININA